ncbi:hypothetical protein KY359_05825 [Candidatus Woesearchaeota archaeon]|nr:hypothetical protein [Candidatus Woesearchaeota archaeon]
MKDVQRPASRQVSGSGYPQGASVQNRSYGYPAGTYPQTGQAQGQARGQVYTQGPAAPSKPSVPPTRRFFDWRFIVLVVVVIGLLWLTLYLVLRYSYPGAGVVEEQVEAAPVSEFPGVQNIEVTPLMEYQIDREDLFSQWYTSVDEYFGLEFFSDAGLISEQKARGFETGAIRVFRHNDLASTLTVIVQKYASEDGAKAEFDRILDAVKNDAAYTGLTFSDGFDTIGSHSAVFAADNARGEIYDKMSGTLFVAGDKFVFVTLSNIDRFEQFTYDVALLIKSKIG